MRIICTSDTHMSGMPLRDYPDADVLVHAGDATFRGRIEEVKYFAKQLAKHYADSRHHAGYQQIIFVPGNHDWLFETEERLAREIMAEHNIITLINESHVYNGVKFWGSPVTPPFHNWAFNWEKEKRQLLWNTIPEDTDVVITHGPPLCILDEVYDGPMRSRYTGCGTLRSRLELIKPKLHVFGHIHECHGYLDKDGIRYVNAAIMDGRYRPENKPILVDLDKLPFSYAIRVSNTEAQ